MNNDVPFSAASSTLTKFPGAKRIELNATRAAMNTTKFRLLTFLYLIQSYPQIKVLSRVMRKFVCRLWLRMKSAGNRDVFQSRL